MPVILKEENVVQIVLTTIAALAAVVVSVMSLWRNDAKAEAAMINKNLNRIVKIESDMEHISYMFEELKKNQMTAPQMRELLIDILPKQP